MTEGKKPLFLVSTEGKSEDEIADEVVEQLRALGINVTDGEQELAEGGGTPLDELENGESDG